MGKYYLSLALSILVSNWSMEKQFIATGFQLSSINYGRKSCFAARKNCNAHQMISSYVNNLSNSVPEKGEDDVKKIESPVNEEIIFDSVTDLNELNKDATEMNPEASVLSEEEEPSASITATAEEVPRINLSLEEEIISALSKTADLAFGRQSRGDYRSVREILRDSKSRSQRRLSRSMLEKDKASEKIDKLEAKFEQEKRNILEELNKKIVVSQTKVEEEVQSIISSLESEIKMEKDRQDVIRELISTIQFSIVAKESDIESEEAITVEMQTVRSKVKPGPIASQLDTALRQKIKVTTIERELVHDLMSCKIEMQSILEESQERIVKIEETIDRFYCPDIVKINNIAQFQWTDIDDMENILEEIAENSKGYQKSIMDVKNRINEAQNQKQFTLGSTTTQSYPSESKQQQQQQSRNQESSSNEKPIVGLTDLQNASDKEVLSVLSESATSVALSGGKTFVFGLKTLLDSMTGNQVTEATSSAFEKSTGIAKGISEITTAAVARTTTTTDKSSSLPSVSITTDMEQKSGNNAAIENFKELVQGEEMKSTLKSTGETFGALGKAGKAFASTLSGTENSKITSKAAKETGKSLLSAFNAVAVLGANQVTRRLNEKKINNDDEQDEMMRP